jgi:pimeloyl-ACP methyl ester carboxylesterase
MLTWGNVEDRSLPLALLVHGFPDTPHTWRHLGPELAADGWRVAAPWLRGYVDGVAPISAGTYVQDILAVRDQLDGDGRTLLVGHDWGANAAYGAVETRPAGFAALVTLAVPPVAAVGASLFGYEQVRRSFYVWLAQCEGFAEGVMAAPGFWEGLWGDWSPGYDPTTDLVHLRAALNSTPRLAAALAPYRASISGSPHVDPAATAELLATLCDPPVPTLYLHGAGDGCMAAELVSSAGEHLPAPGSRAVVLDGCGHFLHLERPDAVLTELRSWLAQLPAPSVLGGA